MSDSHFWGLLLEYNLELDCDSENPKTNRNMAIESELWERYGCSKATLVIDMSGFTKLTQQHGIVHYLSMVSHMKEMVSAKISMYDGVVVKFIADHCLAVFSEPLPAIRFCEDLNNTFNMGNVVTPDELDIYISCGVDFGDVLMLGERECYGNAVNRATKLAKNIAMPGQVLATQEAIELIPETENINIEHQDNTLSGKMNATLYTVTSLD